MFRVCLRYGGRGVSKEEGLELSSTPTAAGLRRVSAGAVKDAQDRPQRGLMRSASRALDDIGGKGVGKGGKGVGKGGKGDWRSLSSAALESADKQEGPKQESKMDSVISSNAAVVELRDLRFEYFHLALVMERVFGSADEEASGRLPHGEMSKLMDAVLGHGQISAWDVRWLLATTTCHSLFERAEEYFTVEEKTSQAGESVGSFDVVVGAKSAVGDGGGGPAGGPRSKGSKDRDNQEENNLAGAGTLNSSQTERRGSLGGSATDSEATSASDSEDDSEMEKIKEPPIMKKASQYGRSRLPTKVFLT